MRKSQHCFAGATIFYFAVVLDSSGTTLWCAKVNRPLQLQFAEWLHDFARSTVLTCVVKYGQVQSKQDNLGHCFAGATIFYFAVVLDSSGATLWCAKVNRPLQLQFAEWLHDFARSTVLTCVVKYGQVQSKQDNLGHCFAGATIFYFAVVLDSSGATLWCAKVNRPLQLQFAEWLHDFARSTVLTCVVKYGQVQSKQDNLGHCFAGATIFYFAVVLDSSGATSWCAKVNRSLQLEFAEWLHDFVIASSSNQSETAYLKYNHACFHLDQYCLCCCKLKYWESVNGFGFAHVVIIWIIIRSIQYSTVHTVQHALFGSEQREERCRVRLKILLQWYKRGQVEDWRTSSSQNHPKPSLIQRFCSTVLYNHI